MVFFKCSDEMVSKNNHVNIDLTLLPLKYRLLLVHDLLKNLFNQKKERWILISFANELHHVSGFAKL